VKFYWTKQVEMDEGVPSQKKLWKFEDQLMNETNKLDEN
jgi:hypothetical protein